MRNLPSSLILTCHSSHRRRHLFSFLSRLLLFPTVCCHHTLIAHDPPAAPIFLSSLSQRRCPPFHAVQRFLCCRRRCLGVIHRHHSCCTSPPSQHSRRCISTASLRLSFPLSVEGKAALSPVRTQGCCCHGARCSAAVRTQHRHRCCCSRFVEQPSSAAAFPINFALPMPLDFVIPTMLAELMKVYVVLISLLLQLQLQKQSNVFLLLFVLGC